jgi:hypothetical protein
MELTMRPTDLAKMNFQAARSSATDAINLTGDASVTGKDTYEFRMAQTLGMMTFGFEQLATGLRATYMLLEEVNGKLDRLGRGRP